MLCCLTKEVIKSFRVGMRKYLNKTVKMYGNENICYFMLMSYIC